MFKNVVVGVDERPGGRDALALATRLIDPGGALTLAHVCDGIVSVDPDAAQRRLEIERWAADVEAELAVIEAWTPGRGLHEHVERVGADLLVLGSCHRGAFGRAMLGDDTRAALNGVPCAVAIAPRGYAEHARPFASVGVGYDGSPESEAALEAAKALAARANATVRAMRVVAFPTHLYTGMAVALAAEVEDLIKSADEQMKALPGVEGQAEYGLVGEDLAVFSKEVDLLIVGSRNYGPMHRLIVGSTSHYLERHARGPLLILPRGTRYATPKRDGREAVAEAPVSA